MEEHQHLPDLDRLSVIIAAILLAYALTPFVSIQENDIVIRLPFIVFYFTLSFSTIVSIFVAALAGAGSAWMLNTHPHFSGNPIRHSVLPALIAWVIGIPLGNMALGIQWWAVFGLGGLLLILVFIAEYIAADFSDVRHALATIGLTALAFAFFLILTISLRASGMRLYLLLPALLVPLIATVLRTLYLRLNGRWCWAWAVGISLVIAQLAIGLQYWPVSPLSYGLILLGPAYALTSVAGSLEEGRSWSSLWIEPVVLLSLTWILAVVLKG